MTVIVLVFSGVALILGLAGLVYVYYTRDVGEHSRTSYRVFDLAICGETWWDETGSHRCDIQQGRTAGGSHEYHRCWVVACDAILWNPFNERENMLEIPAAGLLESFYNRGLFTMNMPVPPDDEPGQPQIDYPFNRVARIQYDSLIDDVTRAVTPYGQRHYVESGDSTVLLSTLFDAQVS